MNELKINILRLIDKYAGPAICQPLLLFKRLTSSSSQINTDSRELKKVLILKFFGIGSILLASPAIGAIKKKYPSAEITLLTLSENKQICEILSSLDKNLYLSIGNPALFLRDYLGILWKCYKENFDAIVDLEFITNFSALTTLLISLFNRNTITIGFNSPVKWRNSVYALNVSFDHSRHISKIFAKVFACLMNRSIDVDFEEEKASLSNSATIKFLENYPTLTSLDQTNQPRMNICVNINSGPLSLLRRWPKEYFAVVVEWLIKCPTVNVVLIGGKSDIDYVQGFVLTLPVSNQIIDLCGKISIRELIGLFSKSSLLITNDSGPLHIAMAVGLPTISFFGPETPYLYGAIGKEHHVFYDDLYCSPCLNIYNSKMTHCKENMCLKNITPVMVINYLESHFKEQLVPKHP